MFFFQGRTLELRGPINKTFIPHTKKLFWPYNTLTTICVKSALTFTFRIKVVDVLTHVTRVAQDYRLSKLLQAFKTYNDFHERLKEQRRVGQDSRYIHTRTSMKYEGLDITENTTPGDVFEHVIAQVRHATAAMFGI